MLVTLGHHVIVIEVWCGVSVWPWRDSFFFNKSPQPFDIHSAPRWNTWMRKKQHRSSPPAQQRASATTHSENSQLFLVMRAEAGVIDGGRWQREKWWGWCTSQWIVTGQERRGDERVEERRREIGYLRCCSLLSSGPSPGCGSHPLSARTSCWAGTFVYPRTKLSWGGVSSPRRSLPRPRPSASPAGSLFLRRPC